ncbi:MAG: V-type ATPase subunit [Oscillospiraceae bacterium]|jgi:V/A-type H+-transporting ATPase subunit C|nr:V-type ATPase subunit [Oscillospiraceae bacterium]
MAKKIKDTDYLFLSSYIHAKESKLIGKAGLERMLEARDVEDALTALAEAWQLNFEAEDISAFEQILAKRRYDVLAEMSKFAPNPAIVDAFRVKYDYHNAKTLVKSQCAGVPADHLLIASGRVAPEKLIAAFLENNFRDLPEKMSSAIKEAVDILAKTSDPQLSDFALDKAYFYEFQTYADESGSEFLKGYVKLSVDAANLRSSVRAVRARQEQALLDGGAVTPDRIKKAISKPETLPDLFNGTELHTAVGAAKAAITGGAVTEFELLTDNALLKYLAQAKSSGFSEKPLIGYICAVENEIAAVRTVMVGRFAGIDPATIKSRLREV